ncbi:MAG: cytochrome c [Sphingobium sp.]|nr:cytochrome c [Sphingobium sp.]
MKKKPSFSHMGWMLTPVALIALVAGCSKENSAPVPEAKAQPKISAITTATFGRDSKDEGERLFGKECAFCHVGTSTGSFMLNRRLPDDQKGNADLNKRSDLEADYVKAVARNGLVNMPAFSKIEISDEDLDKIANYLARKKP